MAEEILNLLPPLVQVGMGVGEWLLAPNFSHSTCYWEATEEWTQIHTEESLQTSYKSLQQGAWKERGEWTERARALEQRKMSATYGHCPLPAPHQ